MNTSDDIAQGKTGLRLKMRARLAEITPQQREAGSRRILEWLTVDDSWVGNATVVALFGGMKSEPDLLPLLPWLTVRDRQTVFFAVGENGIMQPYRVREAESLVSGPFGVLMPDVSKCPRMDEAKIDVVLLPGLAFSLRDGARLGRGKGYYDRVLARLKTAARVIGIGFSVQMIESVPREAHDACVQSLVSEDGWRTVPPPV